MINCVILNIVKVAVEPQAAADLKVELESLHNLKFWECIIAFDEEERKPNFGQYILVTFSGKTHIPVRTAK